MNPPPLIEIPNFEVISKLGSGGMGRVYLCRSVGAYGFKKLVAVKVINPEQRRHDGVRAMFLDEARLVARLDHPAIVQVFDFRESDDALYLVMEYVAGLSLSRLLVHAIPFPPVICASMIAAVCRGLHAAHEAKDEEGRPMNVVHRDVTPSNLLVTFAGQMKILDFGIALMRQREAPVTSVGQIRGKPTYLAPEQFAGGTIDRRTDVYSISIVLHELLTQTKLFTLEKYLDSIDRSAAPANWKEIASGVVPPSATVGPLPAGLDDVVMAGLAVDPRDRFVDAKEMAQALEAIVDREGSETLEAFADREFAAVRQAHDENLRATIGHGSAPETTDEHPDTQDALPPELDPETEAGVASTLILEEPVPVSVREPPTLVTAIEVAPARVRRWLVGFGIAATIALVVVVALVVTPEPSPPASRAAPSTAEAPVEETVEETIVESTKARPPPDVPPPALEEAREKPSKRTVSGRRSGKKASGRRPSRTVSTDGIMQEW